MPIGAGIAPILIGFALWAWVAQRSPSCVLRTSADLGAALLVLTGVALCGAMIVLLLCWQDARGADALGAKAFSGTKLLMPAS